MLEKYREKLHSLILLKAFFTKERSSNLSVSFKDKIWALKHGFLSESNVIYQLDKSNFKFYLSDYDRLKTSLINGKYSTLLDDKVVFENLMNKYLNLPESIAYVNDGRIISINDSYNINSYDSFLDYLMLKKQLVIKPISGGGGKGVLILKVSSSKIYLNSKEISKKELFNTIAKLDKNFISEFIVQGRYGEILYPHTTNTIRIVTMLAPNNHKPFIPIAVQRIGNERSIPSDNWTQGGLSVAIDLDTGELSRGIMYPSNGELKVYDRHPDTGQKFKGGVCQIGT